MRRCLPLLPLAAALWAVANWWPRIRNEFFVIAGSRNESGGWYGSARMFSLGPGTCTAK